MTPRLDYNGPKNCGITTESLLIITGAMGAGKTTVLAEASDILRQQGIAHAAIDLDGLGLAYLPKTTAHDDVMYSNLQSVWNNYASAGVQRLLLARAIETRTELERCMRIVSAPRTVVCRLTARTETMEHRVKLRESGIFRSEYVDRVAKLDAILDRAQLETFTVTNENRPLTEVARQVLVRAGWISN